MVFSYIAALESLFIALSLSADAFTVGLAYGSDGIKIPMRSVQLINIICGAIIGLSFFAGDFLKEYLPPNLTSTLCFVILFLLGLSKLFDGITKSIIRKHTNLNKKINFSFYSLKFILNLYADPEKADCDRSKTISPREAASLAVALSLDGAAVGFGAALVNTNGLYLLLFSLICNMAAILFGTKLGVKIARRFTLNMTCVGGLMLIILAVLKLCVTG